MLRSVRAVLQKGNTQHVLKTSQQTKALLSTSVTYGPGGRASAAPNTVTVFGATGQLGRYVVTELAKQGNTVIVPYRGDDMEWRHLKVTGDLGRVAPIPYNIRDEDSVRQCLQYSNKAINLIGKHYETHHVFGPLTPNYTLYDVNVTAAETVANACNDMGVDHLVHVSSLAANEKSSSEWARTKLFGEKAVKAIRPDATICRLATLFGQEDRFLNFIAYMCRTKNPFMGPFVINGGTNKVQPLWAASAGEAIGKAAILGDEAKGFTYHLAGDDVYTTEEIVDFVLESIQTDVQKKYISPERAEAMGLWYEQIWDPKCTRDSLRLWQEDVVLNSQYGDRTIKDLGVAPRSMKIEAFNYLIRFRKGGHFIEL